MKYGTRHKLQGPKVAPELSFREATVDDANFIFDSWLKSWKSSYFGKLMRAEVFYPNYREEISFLLSSAQVLLACSPEDPEHIFGYIVYEKPQIVHYVYVKSTFKNMGIAKALFKRAVNCNETIVVTHANDYYLKAKDTYTNLLYMPLNWVKRRTA